MIFYRDVLNRLIEEFKRAGLNEPQFEARALMQEAIGVNAVQLLLSDDEPLDEEMQLKVRAWASRRATGYPLAYLSGRRGFYKNIFLVEEGVLIPRPESELLVEVAVRRSKGKDILKISDFGAGTGCIGLSLLREWPFATLQAYEASEKACALIGKNAQALNLSSKVQIHHQKIQDIDNNVPMDVIVANPPYIAEGDTSVQKSVHDFEPHEALYSGADGLKDIRAWTQKAWHLLRPGGLFVVEIGHTQGDAVLSIFKQAKFEQIEIQKDLNAKDRCVSGIRA